MSDLNSLEDTYTLSNGVEIPIVGFGTWQTPDGEVAKQSVKAAIDAGAGSVMVSFNDINGVPATANKWLLTDLLRKQWGFKGFVASDYTGVSELIAHGLGDLKTQFSTGRNF